MNLTHIRGPDLHPRKLRITARGKEAKAYHPEENPKRCQHRALLLAVLWAAAVDYHSAKYQIRAKRVWEEVDYKRLNNNEKRTIDNGKSAWEWFTKEPKPGRKHRYTYKEICTYFKVNPEKLWKQIKKTPTVGDMLGAIRVGEAIES